jgi:hypothetical protein
MAPELIIWLLDVLQNDFGNVDEAMFQGVERHLEIILCIQDFEKVTWTMSLKWYFKLSNGKFNN